MGAIGLRMSEPTIDNAPGDGHVDTIAEQIGEQRAAVAALEPDAYLDSLKPPMVGMVNAAEAARRLHWKVNDKHADRIQAAEALLDARGEELDRANATGGGRGPYDSRFATNTSAGRSQANQEASKVFRAEILEKHAGEAADVGTRFAERFDQLGEAFDRAFGDWSGPAALRSGADNSLEGHIADVAIEKEIESSQRPMTEARRSWAVVIRTGDEKRIGLALRAYRRAAVRVRDTPQPKLRARLGENAQADAAGQEREQAHRLLVELDAYRQTNRPPSLLVAGNLLGVMREIAMVLFGSMPTASWPSEYEIRGAPPRRPDAVRPWQLDRGWIGRYLPGSRSLALPGWSAPIYKGPNGGLAREPRS